MFITLFTFQPTSTPIGVALTSHSPQYVKAMDASFPQDRWPATKIVEPDGAVRFVLKDGTEIHRMAPPDPCIPLTIPARL